ncbi:MAG: hypothetical protein R3C46_08310 [Hyphomonadaceae bacterium]
MFQVSYFLFVLVVGGVTGAAFGASQGEKSARRARLALLGISACVVLGFFVRFGFGWGIITVVELVVGFVIGHRLTSTRAEKNSEISPTTASSTERRHADRRQTYPAVQPGVTQERPRKGSGFAYIIVFVLLCGIVYMGWASTRTSKNDAQASVRDSEMPNSDGVDVPDVSDRSSRSSSAVKSPTNENAQPTLGINGGDLSSLMLAVYPAGPPKGVAAIGSFIIGGRTGLITGADSADNCHACSGSLSIYYLRRDPAGLVVDKSFVDFLESGAWGEYSRDVRIRNFSGVLGQPISGMIHESGYVGQGYYEGSAFVLLFSEEGPHMALSVPMAHNCGDERDGVGVDAEIVDEPPQGSTFAIRYVRKRPNHTDAAIVVSYRVADGPVFVPMADIPGWVSDSC